MKFSIGHTRAYIFNSDDYMQIMIIFFVGLIVITILVWLLYAIIRNSDKKKPLCSCRVKVLEKTSSQGNIEWYIIEKENGERLKLRNLSANKILISSGDIGMITYQGKTITDFKR